MTAYEMMLSESQERMLAVLKPGREDDGQRIFGVAILAFFFALQGLAVVAFYARRLAAPPILRAAVVLLVLVNPWAPQILALMGLFDIWLDLRKYAEPPAEAGAGVTGQA